MREYIAHKFKIDSILNMGEVFEEVTRPACILTFQSKASRNNILSVIDVTEIDKIFKGAAIGGESNYESYPQDMILELPGSLFVT